MLTFNSKTSASVPNSTQYEGIIGMTLQIPNSKSNSKYDISTLPRTCRMFPILLLGDPMIFTNYTTYLG